MQVQYTVSFNRIWVQCSIIILCNLGIHELVTYKNKYRCVCNNNWIYRVAAVYAIPFYYYKLLGIHEYVGSSFIVIITTIAQLLILFRCYCTTTICVFLVLNVSMLLWNHVSCQLLYIQQLYGVVCACVHTQYRFKYVRDH